MKKKQLLDVIFASDKRKNVLLMLHDGPQEMELILAHLDTTRQALLPQMKILKEHHLIYQSDDSYGLTGMGKIVVDEMEPFLNTIETLDEIGHYLIVHNVHCIPNNLLKRIDDIRGAEIIEPSLVNTYEMNKDYLKDALVSKSIYFAFTFMHPVFPSLLKEFVDRDIYVEMILTKEFIQKLKDEWLDVFEHFLACDKVKIYMYEKNMDISSLTVTDNGFLLRLLLNDNTYSNKQLLCRNSKANQWGMDLYSHFLKYSKPVTKR